MHALFGRPASRSARAIHERARIGIKRGDKRGLHLRRRGRCGGSIGLKLRMVGPWGPAQVGISRIGRRRRRSIITEIWLRPGFCVHAM